MVTPGDKFNNQFGAFHHDVRERERERGGGEREREERERNKRQSKSRRFDEIRSLNLFFFFFFDIQKIQNLGLDRRQVRLPSHRPLGQRLAPAAGPFPGALDPLLTAQDPDPLCCGHRPRVYAARARARSIVLETGTGSGSLTHSLARAVAPSGNVYTFEFHAGRAAKAREEFERHGLLENDLVVPRERDIQARRVRSRPGRGGRRGRLLP